MLCIVDIDTENKELAAKLLCDLFEIAMPRAMAEVKRLPPLYKSGVKYISQDPRACAFRSPKEVFERGGGDCKQLVLWRIAECRNAGIHATPRIIWLNGKDKLIAHAQVRHPKGHEPKGDIEDPSYNLGMKQP